MSKQNDRPHTFGYAPVCYRLDGVETEPVEWLWPDRVPMGRLTLMAGDPGIGKSLVALDIAARVTAGLAWPDNPVGPKTRAGDVILIGGEDSWGDTVRPRFLAAGGDPGRLWILEGTHDPDGNGMHPLVLPRDQDVFGRVLINVPECRLVIIDPLSAFLADRDAYTAMRICAALASMITRVRHNRTALLVITHLNKGGPLARRAIYRSGGGLSLRAAARMAQVLAADPLDPARRLMLPLKSNIVALGSGMGYRIEGQRVIWDNDPVETTADEALCNAGGDEECRRAVRWLDELLAAGAVAAKQVHADAKAMGISRRMLERPPEPCAPIGAESASTMDGYGKSKEPCGDAKRSCHFPHQ